MGHLYAKYNYLYSLVERDEVVGRAVPRRELSDGGAHVERDRVVSRGEGGGVGAGGGLESAVGEDGGGAHDHLVHAGHHGEDGRVRDHSRLRMAERVF